MLSVEPDESALLDHARAGDQRAFARLIELHRRVIWGVALRITGNPADAEDAVQDALIAAWRHLAGFRAEARFSTWLYRITANAALAIVRRRRDTDALPEELTDDRPASDEREADRDAVRRALAALPESFRVALVLREYGGLSYQEIAAHQGILVETVKTRLNRARAAVRASLSAD